MKSSVHGNNTSDKLLIMNNKFWRKNFFRFLKEEGVYGEWVYNIYEQHPIWDKKFWEYRWKYELLSEKNHCEEGINYAFCWADTIQGHGFWSALNYKWVNKARITLRMRQC